MKIKVKLYGTLRDKGPKGLELGKQFTIEVDEGATINDVLKELKIQMEEARVVIINSNIVRDYTYQLNSLDLFVCFPPIGGG